MKERNSNIELLRIVAMLLIVAHHYSIHGLGSDLAYSWNRYIAGAAGQGGKLGVTIFVLISGYYMCESRITVRKLAKLWGQIVFYTVIIAGGVSLKWGGRPDVLEPLEIEFGIHTFIEALLPIGYEQYWFATDYVILMMISPLLNRLLHTLRREHLRRILVLSTVIWMVIPTITSLLYLVDPMTSPMKYDFHVVIWFVILYLYAGYIRMYGAQDGEYRRNLLLAALFYLLIILFGSVMIYAWHVTDNDVINRNILTLASEYSLPVLICGIEVLVGVIKIPPHTNRRVNTIGAATFGVYLLHDNVLSRGILWKYLLSLPESVYDTPYLLPHMLVTVAAVFAIGCTIDVLRRNTAERLYMRLVDSIVPYVRPAAMRVTNRLESVVDGLLR